MLGSDDVVETHHTVQCPRKQRAADFARCCGCPQMTSIDVDADGKHGTVECAALNEDLPRGRMDVAEAAVRVRLGDIMALETTCVRLDARTETVSELLVANGLRAVPVVDETRRLVGIVSKTDLLRRSADDETPTSVAEIMTPLVHGLPDEAPIAYAISLMAFEKLHEVPIVDSKNQVIGMITSTDVLRWVAQALGYVVPGVVPAKVKA